MQAPVIAFVVCVLAWVSITPEQVQQQALDEKFPGLRKATYADSGPRVLYDDAHENVFGSATRGKGLVKLYEVDGATVAAGKARFSRERLAEHQVLIASTALGGGKQDAYDADEIAALQEWVRGGGSLLVLADHFPFDRAMASLLRGFDVTIGEGAIFDPPHSDRSAMNTWLLLGDELSASGWLLFSRENGLLQTHPVTEGRTAAERVTKVQSFGGSSVSVPPGATPILRLSQTARADYVPNQREGTPREEAAQGIAFTSGKGKVVVLADASMFGAQTRTVKGVAYPFGMNRQDVDNAQLALNILHWFAAPNAASRR